MPAIERLGAADSALVATVGPLMVLPGARTGIAGKSHSRINLCPTDAADRDGAHAAIINALTQIAAQPWRRDGGKPCSPARWVAAFAAPSRQHPLIGGDL